MKNTVFVRMLVGGLVAGVLIGCSAPGNTETENNTQTESTQNDTTAVDTESEVADLTEAPETESQLAEVELEGKWTELTAEEIAWFNESFFNQEDNQIVNYFLNSEYDDVKDVNLMQLFTDIPKTSNSDLEEAELNCIKDPQGLDIQKVPTSFMNEVLGKYAKLSLEESNKVGIEYFTYLEAYDAYYFERGDYNYREYTMNTGIKNEDGLVKLQYESSEVTLMQMEDGYVFVSNTID